MRPKAADSHQGQGCEPSRNRPDKFVHSSRRTNRSPSAGDVHRLSLDAPPWHAPQDAEGVVVGVEQHLVGLLRIGAENEGAAVGELEVSDLQFGALGLLPVPRTPR